MKKIRFAYSYKKSVSLDNLFEAWVEFEKGKKHKKDVQQFKSDLMDNIFLLHHDLINYTYRHGGYQAFNVCDPKPRNIHKADIRDRLVHHAVYRQLYPFFDRKFVDGSFSCRNKKGTHKAIQKFYRYFYLVSQNNTKTCYCLKMDIRKFFANINHEILLNILRKNIIDQGILWLLENIIGSFETKKGVGLPLGNLTSQLFVNIYMNEFDQFVKHKLKEKYYIRYADDFVILSDNSSHLKNLITIIQDYLKEELKLEIHSDKIFIQTIASGVDFLGIVNFPDYKILRTKTKKRVLARINRHNKPSYLGLLKHCNSQKIKTELSHKNL